MFNNIFIYLKYKNLVNNFIGYSRMFQGDKKKAKEVVDDIFAIVDKNKSGCIDYSGMLKE